MFLSWSSLFLIVDSSRDLLDDLLDLWDFDLIVFELVLFGSRPELLPFLSGPFLYGPKYESTEIESNIFSQTLFF